jgi:hypothetical protein
VYYFLFKISKMYVTTPPLVCRGGSEMRWGNWPQLLCNNKEMNMMYEQKRRVSEMRHHHD